MIESPIFYKFHSREYLSFSERVLQITEGYNLEELGISVPIESVKKVHSQLSDSLTRAVSTELTVDVIEADTLRDNAFMALKFYLQACQKCSKTDWQEAANLLVARVRHYGWTMNSIGYSKQTTQTLNLLNDFENVTDLANAVSKIQAANWVSDLKSSQTNFEQALEVRTEAKAAKVKTSSNEATKGIRQAYESLFKFIEALETISPLEGRQPLIDEFNTVIKEFNTNVKSRATRLASATKE